MLGYCKVNEKFQSMIFFTSVSLITFRFELFYDNIEIIHLPHILVLVLNRYTQMVAIYWTNVGIHSLANLAGGSDLNILTLIYRDFHYQNAISIRNLPKIYGCMPTYNYNI